MMHNMTTPEQIYLVAHTMSPVIREVNQQEKYKEFLKDPKGSFAPPQGYYWIAHKGFSAEDPHAREVIASVYVPLADITAINGEVKDGKSMDQAVKDWADKHADLLKRWENIKKY